MNKSIFLVLVSILFTLAGLAQEKKVEESTPDSLRTNLRKEGIVMKDSVVKKRKMINPLGPSKAAFFSAVIPGLGQAYNKKYWKTPIAIGAIGSGVYMYTYNNDLYGRFRTAFKSRKAGFTTDEFYDPDNDLPTPHFELDKLETQQERFQSDRDLWLVFTIAMYALNIIDANVDAHLKQFNIDQDLSMDFKPYLELSPVTQDPNYGMALIIKF